MAGWDMVLSFVKFGYVGLSNNPREVIKSRKVLYEVCNSEAWVLGAKGLSLEKGEKFCYQKTQPKGWGTKRMRSPPQSGWGTGLTEGTGM